MTLGNAQVSVTWSSVTSASSVGVTPAMTYSIGSDGPGGAECST